MLRGLRSLGLLAFDVLPPAKSALARLSVGAAERVPPVRERRRIEAVRTLWQTVFN